MSLSGGMDSTMKQPSLKLLNLTRIDLSGTMGAGQF